MNIVSLLYMGFVVAVAAVYFITPRKFRWTILLCASVAYYLKYNIKLSIWLFITSASIYAGGLLIARQEERYKALLESGGTLSREDKKAFKKKNASAKARWVALIAIVNIAIWVVFKFTNLFIQTINNWFSTGYSLWTLVLPLGISFYTLQGVSYVIDVSRGKCEAQRNYLKLLLWLCFFPQMIQGPICRYNDTAEQLYTGHDYDYRRVKFGVQRMLWGYFKKLVIADRVYSISSTVFGNSANYQGFIFIVGALAYTVQIYADFSGGMDIISGAAEIFGVYMPNNFERPYFSRSVAEYWRRWHITLGGWFRDYVFYPLSISKAAQAIGKRSRKAFGPKLGKMLPTYIAMLVVWMLNGIWHGAGKQFVVYGLYQGFLIVLGMQAEPLNKLLIEKLHIRTDCFSWRLWQMLRTFTLVLLGRIIFKANGLSEAFRIFGEIARAHNLWVFTDGTIFSLGLGPWEMFVLFVAILVLFAVSLMQEKGIHLRETIERQNIVFRWTLYLVAVFAVILLGVYGDGYDASEFIYAGF